MACSDRRRRAGDRGIKMLLRVLLLIAGSAWIWIGIAWGWGRLLLTSLTFLVVAYGGLVVLAVVDLPTALLCERGRTEVEVSPNIQGSYRFEEYRVGPCVLYNPESTLPGGD